jgi:hypothetical protein
MEKRKMKINKLIVSVSIVALLAASLLAIAPVNAADPTVNADTWFVNTLVTRIVTARNVTTTSGGTINHIEENITWNVMRSPGVAGTVQIGNAKGQTIVDFNNVTNRGTATVKMSMNLTETNSTKNPYGVGILEVTATVDVTSMGTATLGVTDVIAYGTGTLVSTSGTGAFTFAKLYGDFVMNPLFVGALSANGYTEALFFGTHARVNGAGVLVYYPALGASAFCSVTVMKGQTWYFFAQCSGGVGPYTFQWFEGSTLLAGQNSMLLSMNKAAAGTYAYTCIVTDAYGNAVTSNAVTLTVI